jgi:hypothetical protein
VQPRVGSGAYVRAIYAPSRSAPTAAIVRVLQDIIPHAQTENTEGFDSVAIRLRIGGLWSNVPHTALLDSLLSAFGFQYADITETLNAAVILRLGRAVLPDFSRETHYNPDLVQYASAED